MQSNNISQKLFVIFLIAILHLTQAIGKEDEKCKEERHPASWVEVKPLHALSGVILPIVVWDGMHSGQDLTIAHQRAHYLPNHNYKYDDFTQYLPLVTVWGMRLADLPARSKTNSEALTAHAISTATMTAVTHATKWATQRRRPEGAAHNSFPSGHTATAFAFAAILDAEYGADYPWLSAVGYGVASLTGAARIANNRHWATDVITGAGVGMVSTYVGYLLSDLIWKGEWERSEPSKVSAGETSPFMLTLGKSFSNVLSEVSDYRSGGIGNLSSLTARIPIYRGMGIELSGHLLNSENRDLYEYLNAYAVMGGVDYMYPLWNGRAWLDGSVALGYLSEVRLSTAKTGLARKNSYPFVASSIPLRLASGATLITTSKLGLRAEIGYRYVPAAKLYDKESAMELKGWELGIGLSYIINK